MRPHFTFVRSLATLVCACITPALTNAGESEVDPTMPQEAGRTNHLANASSPYLLQHADNPVDWYEWGPEALQRARDENKPIFLSIGYAACHWCHVMAHESFESPEIAAVMNEHFVNIKVDREERPDLDEIYMRATVMMNQGQGGWPMSVWLTPDLKPFFAGTYFPPEAKWGRPGFGQICERIGDLWQTRRDDIENDAQRLTDAVSKSLATQAGDESQLSLATVDSLARQLANAFDRESGGISGGGTNKFPPSMALDVMLRSALRKNGDDPVSQCIRNLVNLTLDRMAAGGIYDQLGGGIHRYSTDVQWHVPHFEKMLYDQALVSRIYLDAYQVTGNQHYAAIARDIFDYVIRDLRSPQGAFYSSRDADSEGEEGKYYVWTHAEIIDVLGNDDGTLFCDYYDVTPQGNWQDPHAPGVPKNILRITEDLETVAGRHDITPDQLREVLARCRPKLLAARDKRVAPGLDDKILCEWNGLMISALARGGSVLDETKYIDAATSAADFILTHQYENGRLHRAYRDGKKLNTAFLTDYANMIEACLDLYEATFEQRWFQAAREINQAAIDNFYDEQHGGFFFTPHDHEQLIARTKDISDAAVPAGNSVQLMNLLRLSVITGDKTLRKRAEKTMHVFADDVTRSPWSAERFLTAVEFGLEGPVELAVIGDPESEGTRQLLRAIHSTYLPNRVLMLRDPGQAKRAIESPLLADRDRVNDQPTAYVCRDYTCQQPTTDPESLAAQLLQSRR